MSDDYVTSTPVVSYRNSTSNHNSSSVAGSSMTVVSYRNSTSNHNLRRQRNDWFVVVSYRNSTSNHNISAGGSSNNSLYLIEILHQTTTLGSSTLGCRCCILSKFYIKPQLIQTRLFSRVRCILSKFYIKPQRSSYWSYRYCVVSYRNSTSNHNFLAAWTPVAKLYLIESLHQTTTPIAPQVLHWQLYLIEILHQTTTLPVLPVQA